MNYYKEIRNELINNEVYKRVKDYSKNRSDLKTYYNVGKLLSEAGKHYGEGIIENYSKKLTMELGKGYSTRTLKNMRKFYVFQKGQALPAQLTWSHYCELLSFTNEQKISYYIKISIDQKLSYRELHKKIKNKEYERLDEETKLKLIENKENKIEDFIKDPIVIKNNSNTNNISEKVLKRLILEDIDDFLIELGVEFSYIRCEYKIKLGNRYNYIDLL